jgi:DNA phosphorothioation-dependent restriction protein DptG
MDIIQTAVLKGLRGLEEHPPPEKNTISAYLPYRNKGADFDFDYVTGSLVGVAYGRKLPPKFEIEKLRENSLSAIESKAASDQLTECINEIYFSDESKNLKQLSPLFKLLHTGKGRNEVSPGSRHLEVIFGRFLDLGQIDDWEKQNYNIFEGIIVNQFGDQLKPRVNRTDSKTAEAEAYLPFIADLFAEDFKFLLDHPAYFVEQVRHFLSLYSFLYCSQMALNIKDWEQGKPKAKPLYFVLDTEKCSTERKAANSYRNLVRSVADVFPTLSMLEVLNERIEDAGGIALPIWRIVEILDSATPDELNAVGKAIDTYTERFAGATKPGRNLKPRGDINTTEIQGKLQLLFKYALDQFDPQRLNERDTRHQMKEKYKAPFEKEVAQHFAQARGRLGKILVMNQDYLLLLTNLAIRGRPSIRLQELLGEFSRRGINFDKQSEIKLITFFERIGNIERMSDSGDAVYVRATV